MIGNKICVVGLGYIGLPTACIFADSGFDVFGVDINPEVVEAIQAGRCHLMDEPGLSDVLERVVSRGFLKVGQSPVEADLFLICVPTPFQDGYRSDLTYVKAAMKSVLACVRPGASIVLESTSPPGTTTQLIAKELAENGFEVGKDVFVAYCPERVLPGKILKELKTNARIVGGVTPQCASTISQYYLKIVDAPVIHAGALAAEMAKLVENSFRDVNIAFANEISMICSDLGVSHSEVIQLANQHPRVKILTPGPGVGGHCIAVDPWFLVEAAPDKSDLVKTARKVNLAKTSFVVEKIKSEIRRRFQETGSYPRVYLYGMSYKPDVADFRESPSVEIFHTLTHDLGNMAEVKVVDPFLGGDPVTTGTREIFPVITDSAQIELHPGIRICLVKHQEFKGLSFDLDFSC